MDSGKDNRQVNLTVKVPVLILYVTAVAEEDGTVHFFDDIYGHDKRLNACLRKASLSVDIPQEAAFLCRRPGKENRFPGVAYSDLGAPGTMRSLSTLKTPGVELACM